MNAEEDDSDVQLMTFYEENNLQLRHVLLDEYETRLKRFVYKKTGAKEKACVKL